MQINAATVAALNKGYKVLFLESFQGAPVLWDKIASRLTTGAKQVVYNWLGAVPGLRELVGEVVIQNLSACEWTLTNKEFESTVSVKQQDIETDQAGIYNPLMQAMGLAGAQHPDELVGTLLNNAFTALDYTGSAFFAQNKKHEPNNSKSATFTNKGTGVLSDANYSIAKANLKGRKNAQGRSMKLGRQMQLVVPPALEDTALKLVKATTTAAGATNIQQGTAEVVVLPELTSDTAWFLLDASFPIKALAVQIEKPVEFNALTDPNSDHVFLKKEFLYQAYGRHTAAYMLPQLAYGSTGAG